MSTGSVAAAVRSQQPLVHCITAAVSMGTVADGLLAAGARPVMTETDDCFLAAVAATCWIGLAGELAASRTRRPGVPDLPAGRAGRGRRDLAGQPAWGRGR